MRGDQQSVGCGHQSDGGGKQEEARDGRDTNIEDHARKSKHDRHQDHRYHSGTECATAQYGPFGQRRSAESSPQPALAQQQHSGANFDSHKEVELYGESGKGVRVGIVGDALTYTRDGLLFRIEGWTEREACGRSTECTATNRLHRATGEDAP